MAPIDARSIIMDLRYKTNLLEHLKVVSAWARLHEAKAFIDASTGALAVQRGRRGMHALPQYVGPLPDGSLAYFPNSTPDVNGFVGWLPYPIQNWPISSSKPTFKQTAIRLGIRTPEQFSDGAHPRVPYLVTQARSAFGYGMRGPFRPLHAGGLAVELRAGEFAEAFKVGAIARAWYWAGRLAVLECFDMPVLCGDGRADFIGLLSSALPADRALPTGSLELGLVQGHAIGVPIPLGTRVIADYRYVSPFNPTVYSNHNRMEELHATPLAGQFIAAGSALWSEIPNPLKRGMAFVLDAIVDESGQAWFLEINSNAQLHPEIYRPMLDALLLD